MAKIITEFAIKITINYGCIIGTVLVLAGIYYLFAKNEAVGAASICTIGSSLILGRSLVDKMPNGAGGGAQKPIPRKPGK
jgi:uncharacterized membrane protein